MKENLTEIIFILDRSGSMGHLTSDTIGGYNSFINAQKESDGEALVTTVLFDNQYEILHNGINLSEVNPLTSKEYFTRGSTALLDAIGTTINNVGNRLNETKESDKPSKVIFVITTDGEENCSTEFSRNKIKEMIIHQQEKYNWQFMFLGANIDAVGEAQSIGIKAKYASNYTANSIGTESLYASVSKSVLSFRADGEIKEDWKDRVK